jgi:hypothetical protein
MESGVSDEIAELLAMTRALTIRELAERLDRDGEIIADAVWSAPERFAWQPGGLWTLAAPKQAVSAPKPQPEEDDTRPAILTPPEGVELRAITLSNGATLRATRRPLDSSAVFAVRASGGDLELALNSDHEIFASLPMPFDEDVVDGDFRTLVEMLLVAWATHEGTAPPAAKRSLEDARMMWGRALLDISDPSR